MPAKWNGYASQPSGVYLGNLVERMGIAVEVNRETRSVASGGTIGTPVAAGDPEIGFQQVSELVHIPGIDYAGPLPADIQRVTIFSSGIQSGAENAAGAKALQQFLTTPAAAAVMRKHGLETS